MIEETAARLAACLDSAEIPYMIIGGFAVAVRGEPRMTQDIDVTLGVDADALQRVLAAVRTSFEAAVEDPGKFVSETNVIPLLDRQTKVRCDLIFSFIPYEREAIERSESVEGAKGQRINVVSPEDLVVYKMLAGRPRDLEDVRGILLRQGEGLDGEAVSERLRGLALSLDRHDLLDDWHELREA